MGISAGALCKAGGEVRAVCGSGFDQVRVDRQDDPLVDHLIDLREVMAFELVDDEEVAGVDVIEAVVDQKLLAAGDGVIEFVTVMDMHIHGPFLIVQVGDGEIFPVEGILDGGFAGGLSFHIGRLSYLIAIMYRKEQLYGLEDLSRSQE